MTMSIPSHQTQGWDDYLVRFKEPDGLSTHIMSFITDQDAMLISALSPLAPPTLDQSSQQRSSSLPHSTYLVDYLPLSYQDRFRSWLAYTSIPNQVICSLSVEQEIWVQIQMEPISLNLLNHYEIDQKQQLKLLTISTIRESIYREQLSARNTGLFGFKHDLANRLFLFQALPELLEFSEPTEILNDVVAELPTLLHFFEHRLSETQIGNVPFAPIRSSFDFRDQMSALIHDHNLSKYLSFHSHAQLQETHSSRSHHLLGLEWSLRYFALLAKQKIFPHQSGHHAVLTLKPYIADDLTVIKGDCGRLLADDAHLYLNLHYQTDLNVNFTLMFNTWRAHEHLSNQNSALLPLQLDQSKSLASWFGTWVNAAHGLGGVIKLIDDQSIAIIF
jgi:hypothetical protein